MKGKNANNQNQSPVCHLCVYMCMRVNVCPCTMMFPKTGLVKASSLLMGVHSLSLVFNTQNVHIQSPLTHINLISTRNRTVYKYDGMPLRGIGNRQYIIQTGCTYNDILHVSHNTCKVFIKDSLWCLWSVSCDRICLRETNATLSYFLLCSVSMHI